MPYFINVDESSEYHFTVIHVYEDQASGFYDDPLWFEINPDEYIDPLTLTGTD